MSPEQELDLKFLERALQQQESARQTFFRDLKIAAIALLAFQFVIFFRFIPVNDQRSVLDEKRTPLLNAQKALSEIQAQLAVLEDTLKTGKKQVDERLARAPDTLRKQMLDLEREIESLRAMPSAEGLPPMLPVPSPFQEQFPGVQMPLLPPSPTPPAPSPIQAPPRREFWRQDLPPSPSPPIPSPIQAPPWPPPIAGGPPPINYLLRAGLSDSELSTLKKGDPEGSEFRDILNRIVDKTIVQSVFADLNASKNELLEKPFAEKASQLLTTLERWRSILKPHGLDTGAMEKEVKGVEAKLHTLKFTASASDRWWRTYRGKEARVQTLESDTAQVVGQIRDRLLRPEQDLALFGRQLTTLIQEGEVKKKELDDEMQKLQSRYDQVQLLLQNYTKPLSVLALEPKDAVLYYPVILAAVFAYFVWRYVLLHRRARFLATAYRKVGVPDEILLISFPDVPGFAGGDQAEKPLAGRPVARGLVVLLGGIPAALAAVSIHSIRSSPSLVASAPLFLYLIGGALFIISYLVLAVCILRPTRERHGRVASEKDRL